MDEYSIQGIKQSCKSVAQWKERGSLSLRLIKKDAVNVHGMKERCHECCQRFLDFVVFGGGLVCTAPKPCEGL